MEATYSRHDLNYRELQFQQYILDQKKMTTRCSPHVQAYDKENFCEAPPLKSGKTSEKEKKKEGAILGIFQEDSSDSKLMNAKRKMNQKSVEGFVLKLQPCLVEQQQVL